MSFSQVKFGEQYLSFHENGEASISSCDQDLEEIPEIKSDGKILPIQFNQSAKKVLIQSDDFRIIDLESKEISYLFLNSNLINVFWSQIEENFVIAAFNDEINIIDCQEPFDISNLANCQKVIKSFKINNLSNCKSFQSNSILSQFSLILLVGEKELCLLTPFVSNNFSLEDSSYIRLKESLPNIKKKYFDKCFTQKENGIYQFDSLFGIDIEPVCYPINLSIDKGNIVDFSNKDDSIFVLFEDKSIARLSLRIPSFFDSQQIINAKCNILQNIEITQFVSTGSYLFGFGTNTYQFFNECVIQSRQDKQIIGIIKSNSSVNGLRRLILLFSNNIDENDNYSIEEVDDESIYYECDINERLKNLQQRKCDILQKKLNVQLKLNQFHSEISKLVHVKKINLLQKRVKELENLFVQTDEYKKLDINKIQKDIPKFKDSIPTIYNEHISNLQDQNKDIELFKNLNVIDSSED